MLGKRDHHCNCEASSQEAQSEIIADSEDQKAGREVHPDHTASAKQIGNHFAHAAYQYQSRPKINQPPLMTNWTL